MTTDNGWRHVRVVSHPINSAFELIVLDGEDDGLVAVIAELVEVLEC